uniref:Uncharacterized protein n=1 Tax=Lutzomyia longipalpis TaxID=7200 RepID=A0A1B0CC57_LUTLO
MECLDVTSMGIGGGDDREKVTNSQLIWIDILSMTLQNIYSKDLAFMQKISLKNLIKCLIGKHKDSGRDTATLIYYSYHLFTIVNNTFFVENASGDEKEFREFIVEIESRRGLLIETYRTLMENNPEMSAKIVNLWIEIYVNFKEVEVQHIKEMQKNQVLDLTKDLSHHFAKQQPYRKFICFLECLLLHILPFCMTKQKAKILTTLKNIGLCCCNCARWSIKIFLDLCTDDKLAKQVLLLTRKAISTIYRSNCRMCFEKTSMQFADDDLINNYRLAVQTIPESFIYAHLASLPPFLPCSIKSRILLDILWPMFIKTSNSKIPGNQDLRQTPERGLLLQTMSSYLQDPVLIRIFLNTETLDHLKGSLHVPNSFPHVYRIFQNSLQHLSKIEDLENETKYLLEKIIDTFVENTKSTAQVLKLYFRKIHPHVVCENENQDELLKGLQSNVILKTLTSGRLALNDVLDLAQMQWRMAQKISICDLGNFEWYFQEKFFNLKDIFALTKILLSFLLTSARAS